MKILSFSVVLSIVAISADHCKKVNYDWNDYYSHEHINDFIDSLDCAKKWVNTISIGKTYEGRDMRVIEINRAGPNAPIAWIEAGIHAR